MTKLSIKTKVVLGIVLTLLIGLMVAGCAKSTSASASKGFTDFDHIEKEYLDTIDDLNWPDGFTTPTKLENEDKSVSFEVGYGNTKASDLWEYVWMKEWLHNYNTDPGKAAKALTELEKAFDMPYMSKEKCDDATRSYLHEIIDKAKAGDPSGFEDFMKANY